MVFYQALFQSFSVDVLVYSMSCIRVANNVNYLKLSHELLGVNQKESKLPRICFENLTCEMAETTNSTIANFSRQWIADDSAFSQCCRFS